MGRVTLDETLSADYRRLFETCVIRDDKAAEVEAITIDLLADRGRYQMVGDALGIPWFIVAVIHYAETGRDFTSHLHNGDPLTERTTHLPEGRPQAGEPPFSWEDSALDALRLAYLDQREDWSIPGALFELEGYDGWGYRLHQPGVPSPYLWNYSSHYTSGKFVADGTFSETAVGTACGVGVLLRRLAEQGVIGFHSTVVQMPPFVRYAVTESVPWAIDLQRFLNSFPGIFVKVDGWPGPRTSDAFRKVCGRYLLGDPRES